MQVGYSLHQTVSAQCTPSFRLYTLCFEHVGHHVGHLVRLHVGHHVVHLVYLHVGHHVQLHVGQLLFFIGHLVHLHVGHHVHLYVGHHVSHHVGHHNVVSTLTE